VQAPLLLPSPRRLRVTAGACLLSESTPVRSQSALARETLDVFTERLNSATDEIQFRRNPARHFREKEPSVVLTRNASEAEWRGTESLEAYGLSIGHHAIHIQYRDVSGLRAAGATLCQLLRQYGRRLPCLEIVDWPDFVRRGVLLDVSRGRVPKVGTLMQLATDLAGFKINELQLYMEHTFAYKRHREVWRGWSPLTGREIQRLDAHCTRLGIDLVPNQNSFGHLRYFLAHKKLKSLAEVPEPYPSQDGTFLRHPSTLAPLHRGTIPFLRGLYDELLPHFSSACFNVGCDETWDLGRGQSRRLCAEQGTGRVYLDFLHKIHREVTQRDRRMMFWGDIILNHPNLIPELPKDAVALQWGYEANHPFQRDAQTFSASGIPFHVCPGTSSWQTLIGRNDNALPNLRAAALAGKRNGALGYLIADWGDGGHPQPLVVSYPAFLAGAGLAWCTETFAETQLIPSLSREVFHDPGGAAAKALMKLGVAHRSFRYEEPNATPFGATLAAPPSEQRELFCRNGLKYYAHLLPRRIRAAWAVVEKERIRLRNSEPASAMGRLLAEELDLAARMAGESCRYLLWQKQLASGDTQDARVTAKGGIRHLESIELDFTAYWPKRNKGTPAKCAPFLSWRIDDYRRARLHYVPEETQLS